MTDIDKADVYRKAAEVIVRDGKTDCGLTEAGEQDEDLKNPELAVCALGACARRGVYIRTSELIGRWRPASQRLPFIDLQTNAKAKSALISARGTDSCPAAQPSAQYQRGCDGPFRELRHLAGLFRRRCEPARRPMTPSATEEPNDTAEGYGVDDRVLVLRRRVFKRRCSADGC